MKLKTLTVLALVASMSTSGAVYAQTKTASPTATVTTEASPSAAVEENEVQTLKDKVANKVAELMKKDKKAVAGKITAVKGNVITILSTDEVEYSIKRDDSLTKIYNAGDTKKELKSDVLKKDVYIIASGPVLDKSVEANTIYIDEQYMVKSGKIVEVNKDDYTIKVLTTTKDNYTLDVESKTSQMMVNIKTLEQEKIGFSKLKEGDVIYFTVKASGADPKETNRYSAVKVLIIPQEYFLK